MVKKENLDVLAELAKSRQDMVKFFDELDSKKMLFREYVEEVMVKFNCTRSMAGKMIMNHVDGLY